MEHSRAVIFDLDGTLVDNELAMRVAFRSAYERIGLSGEPPIEEARQHFGKGFRTILIELGLPLELHAAFIDASYAAIEHISVYPEVEEMLRQLRALGFRLAVATGKDGARARRVMSEKGLLPFFDLVLGSDETARGKPAPDVVEAICERFHCRKELTMMVGDALADVQCALAAEITAVFATWSKAVLTADGGRAHYTASHPRDVVLIASHLCKNYC